MPAIVVDCLQVGACAVTLIAGLYGLYIWMRGARPLPPAIVSTPIMPVSDDQVRAWRDRAKPLVTSSTTCRSAIELLNQCIAHRPQWAYCYELRGLAHMNLDRTRYRVEAIADFRSALRLNPDSRARGPLSVLLGEGRQDGPALAAYVAQSGNPLPSP